MTWLWGKATAIQFAQSFTWRVGRLMPCPRAASKVFLQPSKPCVTSTTGPAIHALSLDKATRGWSGCFSILEATSDTSGLHSPQTSFVHFGERCFSPVWQAFPEPGAWTDALALLCHRRPEPRTPPQRPRRSTSSRRRRRVERNVHVASGGDADLGVEPWTCDGSAVDEVRTTGWRRSDGCIGCFFFVDFWKRCFFLSKIVRWVFCACELLWSFFSILKEKVVPKRLGHWRWDEMSHEKKLLIWVWHLIRGGHLWWITASHGARPCEGRGGFCPWSRVTSISSTFRLLKMGFWTQVVRRIEE